jgi:hypothetical protein
MPQFSYPIYVVYATDLDESLVRPALEGLRSVATVPRRSPSALRKTPKRGRPG